MKNVAMFRPAAFARGRARGLYQAETLHLLRQLAVSDSSSGGPRHFERIVPLAAEFVTESCGGLLQAMAKVFSPDEVFVVVDREFGEQLTTLTPGVPVWIV